MTSPQTAGPHTGFGGGAARDGDTLQLPTIAEERPDADPSTTMRERWEGTGFRPDIQGLRAVAVALVLLSHAGFGFASGGYVGVDVFFVLSGFLITSLLVKEVFDTGKISIAGFYARRARRILPAASAVTIVTVVAAWLWFPITRLEAVMQDAFAVIAYYINYRFVAESTEYLNADQMPSPFQQYWSLAVEEQFYVVWPLLLLIVLLAARRRPRAMLKASIVLCAVIFAVSLVASALITETSQPTAYYAGHTRAWELAAGALLALSLPTWKKVPRAAAVVLGVIGLGAIAASGLLYTEATPFPGYTALLPVVGTMAVIVAGAGRSANPVSSLLSTGPFQFFGKISYSLYLWHWPVLILAPLALDVEPTLLLNVILLAGTVTISMFSYEYIETPVRNARLLKVSNLRGLATGAVCSLAGVAMILALTVGFSKAPDDAVDLQAIDEAESISEVERKLREGLATESVPANLTPALARVEADRPITYPDGCHLDFDVVELPDGCVYGDPDSDTTVVLVGDSHAAQWFPALNAIAEERGWALLSRTKSACTPVSVRVESTMNDGEYTECWDWKQNVFDELDDIEPDLVVVGTADPPRLLGSPDEENADEWASGWSETLDRATAAAGEVVTLTDTPRATDDAAPDCVALNMNTVTECLASDPYRITHEERRNAGIEAAESAGARVIDTQDWLCIDGQCPLIVDGLQVYRDQHHLSTPYAVSFSDLLAEELPRI